MRMTADDHIHALLHQEICPLLFIFRRHGFHLLTPMRHKDHAVADAFGFLNGCGNFCLVKQIYGIVRDSLHAGIICSVRIIQKGQSNSVDLHGADLFCVFLGIVQSQKSYIRIIRVPIIHCLLHVFITVIIHMIGGAFDHVKTRIDQGVRRLCGCGKGRIAGNRIVIGGKNRFLIHHSHVRSLDLIQNIQIKVVIIPFAGVTAAGRNDVIMKKIIPYGNDADSGDYRGIGGFFRFLRLLGRFARRFLFRLSDQVIIQLLK